MMQPQPPSPTKPPKRRRWYNDPDLFWQGFLRSNYVTAFTDWFMGLAGKLAEVVLYVTVLYSGAELYPGVALPAGLNLSMFLLQMGALDIGGIGLGKLARQARDDGNREGADKAERLSQWLIRIMIASIVTVSAEQVLSRLPGAQAIQPAIQVVQAIVELVLAVARAICAVLYGKVVHALKPKEHTPGLHAQQDDLREQVTLLQQQHQNLQAHLHTTHLHLADLQQAVQTINLHLADLQQAVQARSPHRAAKEPARSQAARAAASHPTQNITSIDQVRAKHQATQGNAQRISHADVLAYIAQHPNLKRAEVAAHLGISERKVYEALAWQKAQGMAVHS
jgi:hypothetical protein